MKFKNFKELENYIKMNHDKMEVLMAENESGDPYGYLLDVFFEGQNHEEELANLKKDKAKYGHNISYWSMVHQVEEWRDERLKECTELINKYMQKELA